MVDYKTVESLRPQCWQLLLSVMPDRSLFAHSYGHLPTLSAVTG